MFDFDSAIADANSMLERRELEAIILAPSGSGKSALCGTIGKRTLYIFSSGENHGPQSARANARRHDIDPSFVVPFCIDLVKGADGTAVRLNAEQAYERLRSVLADGKLLAAKGIEAVALDGAAELEIIIRDLPEWKKACLSASGKHNAFAEPTATATLFRPVINALKDLQRDYGMHFVMTCMLDVKDQDINGAILEAAPRLKGFQVAEQLIQQFNDVLVVGKMTKGSESKWKLQFMADIVKVAKEENGTQKRAMNFNPRIAGATCPPYLDADLRQVVALKEKVV